MQTLTLSKNARPGFLELGSGPGPTGSMALDRLLDRERSRADRLSSPLSLIVLAAGDSSQSALFVQTMAEGAISRMRSTDEIGLAEDNRLFIILPHTDDEGAIAFAKHLMGPVNVAGFGVDVAIYQYNANAVDKGRAASWVPVTPDPFIFGRHEPREHGAGLGLTEDRVEDLRKKLLPELMFARRLPRWKRAMDISGALFGLILISPILLAAAIAVRITSRGPIIFRQLRTGIGGAPFTIYKFRTMIVDAEKLQEQLKSQSEQDGPAFKLKNDPRITRIGKFLRATSIDELPQLWNVVKGDMSLVGPRPLPVDQSAECAPWHARRLDVTPGLTCTWQATAGSMVTFDEWARMDARYAKTRSLQEDIAIILRTIPAVVKQRGAQ